MYGPISRPTVALKGADFSALWHHVTNEKNPGDKEVVQHVYIGRETDV